MMIYGVMTGALAPRPRPRPSPSPSPLAPPPLALAPHDERDGSPHGKRSEVPSGRQRQKCKDGDVCRAGAFSYRTAVAWAARTTVVVAGKSIQHGFPLAYATQLPWAGRIFPSPQSLCFFPLLFLLLFSPPSPSLSPQFIYMGVS